MDYRDFKSSDPTRPAPKRAETELGEVAWWDETDERARNDRFMAVCRALQNDQADRSSQNLLHARLYGNFDAGSTGSSAFVRPVYSGQPSTRASLNVIASGIDTLCSKISKNRPRPSFQTDGAGWDMQQRARKLDKWTRGQFYESKAYEHGRAVFKDGLIFGTGAMKVYIAHHGKKKQICCERVFIDEIFVDECDGLYGEPQTIYQKKLCSRDMLMKHYGDDENKMLAIRGAKAPHDLVQLNKSVDLVEVWEGWKLHGRHTISIEGAELMGEAWDYDFFPFVFFRYNKRVLGFWGQGVSEKLVGIQQELNRLIRSVSDQLRRKGRGRIFVQTGSKVAPNHITNRVADIVFYTGQHAPVVDNSNAVAPEEFQQIRSLREMAFQEIGVSEMSAAAKKPSGLDAAVALREFSDIESDRFATLVQDWETFYLDLAQVFIKLARQMGDYKVKIPNRRFVEAISWKEIALEEDQYSIQMFPVSSLPQTPAARYQKVKEMLADQFITKAVAQRLLEFPDIEAESNLGNAAIDDCDATISLILDAKTPKLLPPEKYQNLEMLISRATSSYLFARHHGCPKDRLELLRQLIDRAAALVVGVQPPAPPPGAPGAAPQMPGGMAPPMSMGPQMGNLSVQVGGGAPPSPAVPPLIG